MKRTLCLLLFFAPLLFFASCEKKILPENGKLRVVCTTQMIADLVKGIGGEYIQCTTLIKNGQNPRTYAPTESDYRILSESDTIIFNGLGLESTALAYALEKNPKAHSIGGYFQSTQSSAIITIDDIPDPHIWMDPGLWKECIPYITSIFEKKMPDKAAIFQDRSRMLDNELAILNAEALAKMRAIPKNHRYLVTIHQGFNYFVRAYFASKEAQQTLAWKNHLFSLSKTPASLIFDAQDVQQAVAFIKKNKIETIFRDAYASSDAVQKIVDACQIAGHNVAVYGYPLYADMQGSEFASYQEMFRYDVEAIYDALYNWYESTVKKVLR